MKMNDRQTLKLIKKELNNAAEKADVPERLQKEFIVDMLKNGVKQEKDFSDKTGTNKIIYLRRIAAAAAVFVIVAVSTIFVFRDKPFISNTDPTAKSGFNMDSPIRKIKSIDEIEKAVKNIFGGKNSADDKSSAADGRKENPEYVAAPKNETDDLNHGIVDGEENSSSQAADIVRNDGKYLYIVTSNTDREKGITSEQIKIVSAVPAEEMKTVSTITLSDSSAHRDECFEIYLKGNSLVALMKRYSGDPSASKEASTIALFYDISDPTAPVKTREHIQDGSYVSSKIYGGRLCLITNKKLSDMGEKELSIPAFSVDGIISRLGADNILMSVNDPEGSYLFITLTDIDNSSEEVGKLAILGSGSNIYCSSGSVYISRAFVSVEADEQGNRKNLTEIYKFNCSVSGIGLSGSCVLEGNVPSSSFMDEFGGNLRVASLDSNSGSIYILNDKMEIIGKLEKAFNISFIPNIKFIANKAYIIGSGSFTVIDLSDPAAPASSVSDKSGSFALDLFKLSTSKYIGVSHDSSSGSTVLTLYDISDSDSPEAVSTYSLDSSFSLPAADDEKSLMVINGKNIFGIPVIKNNTSTGSEISEYILFNTSDGIISPLGTFDHDGNYISDAAVRAEVIGNILYTISGKRVVAFSMTDASKISTAEIR